MGPYEDVIQELKDLMGKKLCPIGVISNILLHLEGEGKLEYYVYLILSNDWDKVRGYPRDPLLKVLAKLPYARKYFWELRETARQFRWQDRVEEWDNLLEPYMDLRKQDMSLTVG